MEDIETKVCYNNLDKLKKLVDKLEFYDTVSEDYHNILSQIDTIIKQENKVIKTLKKPENKIKHYETICTTIVSLLSTIKI